MIAAGLAACSSPDARPPASPPSFAGDIAPLLEARCASARGCHGADPTPMVDLDLRRAHAYRQLVAVPAETGRSSLLRVEPGHPAASVLIQKLTGRAGAGKPMPLDPATEEPARPIAPAWIEAVLVPWIAAGAPDN